MTKRLNIVLLAGILLIGIYAPIALSAYTLGSRTLIQLIVLALFATWFLSSIRHGKIPLPGNLLSWSLLVVTVYLTVSTIFSIYPHRSATELRSNLCYIAIFALTIAIVKRENWIRTILWILAALCGVLTLFGFVLLFSISNTIFGLIPVHNIDQLASTFPNYNHFAAYLGVIIPGALALWWIEKSPRRPMLLLLIGIMIAGLFFTLSRGGIGSFIIGMVLFVLLLPKSGKDKMRWWGTLLILAITMTVMLLTVHEPLSMRWVKSGEVFPVSRITLWQTALHAFLARPLFGFGLGTFRIIYPIYNQNPTSGYYRHALNDYLEVLPELGTIGLILIAVILVVLFYVLAEIARKHRSSDLYIIAIASITSISILLVNALVNFPSHIPAISFTLALLAALPLALSSDIKFIRYVEIHPSPLIKWCSVSAMVILALFLGSETVRPFLSQRLMSKAQIQWKQHNSQEAIRMAFRAISWDPKDAQNHDTVGKYYQFSAGEDGDHEMHLVAISSFKRASELNSWSASYHYHLGEANVDLGNYREAKVALAKSIELDSHYLPPRLKLIQIAIHEGDTSLAILQYRELLTSDENRNHQILADACRNLGDVSAVSAIIDPSDMESQLTLVSALMEFQRWEDCKTILRSLLSRYDDKRVWNTYLYVLHANQEDLEWFYLMAEYVKKHPEDSHSQNKLIRALTNSDIEFPTDENYVKLAFPDTASFPYKMTVAGRLLKERKYQQSGEVFFNILETDPNNPAVLIGLGQSYEYSRQYLEAILIYHRILELNPSDINARFRLAMSYRRQGMLAQAVEQLEECLTHDPYSKRAKQQLAEIQDLLNLVSDSTTSYSQ